MFPACSTQLVSGRVPATGQLPSAGCRSVPIGWLPGVSACHISYLCLSAACDLVGLGWFHPGSLSVSAPGRFPSTSLMCACSSYMISSWLIPHSFRPVYLSTFPSFLSWFILGQLPSANLPPVRLACLCDRIVSDGSRSVAMGCCPAGSSLLTSDKSIAVDVRSVPLDGFAAGASELVIGNFPGTCMQSAHLSDQMASAGCSPVSRPVSGRSLSMELLLDHISLLPDFPTLLHDEMVLAPAFHSCPLILFPADSCCMVCGIYL